MEKAENPEPCLSDDSDDGGINEKLQSTDFELVLTELVTADDDLQMCDTQSRGGAGARH